MNSMFDHPPDPRLDGALVALRNDTSAEAPPPSVDAAIAAAIARASRRRSALRLPSWQWLVAPIAVAALALVFVTERAGVVRDASPDASVVTQSTGATPGPTATQFMPIVPIAEIERSGNALIVPARVPRMSLAELGLPVNPARADDAIDAELLVRRDGTLLAVRFTY